MKVHCLIIKNRNPYVRFSFENNRNKISLQKHDCYVIVVGHAAVDLPKVVANEAARMVEESIKGQSHSWLISSVTV